jgi:formylglycine-generating enzyme required for sulfatase activity
VLIPATGDAGFLMGKGLGREREHRVVLTRAFCIEATEVTVRAYAACVDAKACRAPLSGDPFATYPRLLDHPVTMVSWLEARAYCAWSSKRLPTEAEWEWAAGGPTMTKYPWGDAPEPSCDEVDFTKYGAPKWKPGGDVGCHGGGPSAVATHPKGDKLWPGGRIHDLAGNVYEWVEDSFETYKPNAVTDPVVHNAGIVHPLRGGAWNRSYTAMEVTHRAASYETYKVPGIGVRCARDAR